MGQIISAVQKLIENNGSQKLGEDDKVRKRNSYYTSSFFG